MCKAGISAMLSKISRYVPKIRMLLLRYRFASAGRRAGLGKGVEIHGHTKVHLGTRTAIRDRVQFAGGGKILIGDRTAINGECIITAVERVEIGSDVMLAPRVYILDVDHRFDSRDIPISQQGYTVSPVKVGNGAWIGTGAVITKGVTIGEGAIVGANSVVTKDVPDYAIAGGIPAKVIGQRP